MIKLTLYGPKRLEDDEEYRKRLVQVAIEKATAGIGAWGKGEFEIECRSFEHYEGPPNVVADLGPGYPINSWVVDVDDEPEKHPREGERLLIRITGGKHMSRGKYAAQAVHAALELLGVHPHTPVIVLGGSQEQVRAMPVHLRDAGVTELRPGTLTAGAEWATGRVPNGEEK